MIIELGSVKVETKGFNGLQPDGIAGKPQTWDLTPQHI